MSKITKEEVLHIAKLAEIDFKEDELDTITQQLDKILSHVAKISEVDTSDINPTSHTLEIKNVFRKDIIKESLKKEDALKNAPQQLENGFLVPKID